MRILSSFLATALLGLSACASPLDLDTPRIDTRLTSYLRTTKLEVTAIAEGDTFAISSWKYRLTRSYLALDTATGRYWVDYELTVDPESDAFQKQLQQLRLRLDSVTNRNVFSLGTDPTKGSGVKVVTSVAPQDSVYSVECMLNDDQLTGRGIAGTFLIIAAWGGTGRARIVVDFAAEQ